MFAFRLCLALGVEHPDYLRLSSSQISDWVAFDRQQPIGDLRSDVRHAALMSLVYNAWRGKGSSAASVEQFMPYWKPPEQDWREAHRIMAGAIRRHNERVNRGRSC